MRAATTPQETAIRERQRRQVLARCEQIAPLPAVVSRVLELLDDPDSDAAAIERALEVDPVFCARLLTLANSPLFGASRQVTTISHALVLVGFTGVRNLALAASISPDLQHDFRAFGYAPDGLWRHSVAVGAAARCLAELRGTSRKLRDELFVAGLLHDIGKIAILPSLDPRSDAVRGGQLTDPQKERELLGIDHAEAGGLVAAKWNLGPALEELIIRHHQPVDPTEGELAQACALLRVAHDLAHEWRIGYARETLPPTECRAEDLAAAGLSSERWSSLSAEIRPAVDQVLTGLAGLD